VFDGNLGLGRHSFEWSGRDDAGQPVASGVYLYTLTTHQQTLSKKMLVVK
jgi:flagellar hook assembly protein FlgD